MARGRKERRGPSFLPRDSCSLLQKKHIYILCVYIYLRYICDTHVRATCPLWPHMVHIVLHGTDMYDCVLYDMVRTCTTVYCTTWYGHVRLCIVRHGTDMYDCILYDCILYDMVRMCTMSCGCGSCRTRSYVPYHGLRWCMMAYDATVDGHVCVHISKCSLASHENIIFEEG
jgi:hypothetical protein